MTPWREHQAKLSEGFSQVQAQFRDLELRQAFLWPLWPRALLLCALCGGLMAGLWWGWLSEVEKQLRDTQAVEVKLRQEYRTKLTKAVNLEALTRQRAQILHDVAEFEKQLPGKEGMDTLISAINQAGTGRHLQFELFRPGPAVVKDFYAEQAIALIVTGNYHDMAGFAADMAHFARIVTLSNLGLVPASDGTLTLETTAKTYRSLDAAELALKTGKPGSKERPKETKEGAK